MTKLFGRSYNTLGESNADLILKTKGQIKIQWGKKFIDLIKDGKINSGVDALFYQVPSKSEINPSKNGLYYVTDDDSLWVVIGGQTINLKGEIGTTYVSFLGEQETTGEQKHTALTNIGFLFPSVEEASSSNLPSGIVYIESEQKLYTVVNGSLSELQLELPNPYPKQLVIQNQNSDTTTGALIIEGQGEGNSLIVGDIMIYQDSSGGHIISDSGLIVITGGGQDLISIGDTITMHKKVVFEQPAISSMFQSQDATQDQGFRLYVDQNGSTLEVDNLVVRNQSGTDIIYPKYWSSINNVIIEADTATDPDDPSRLGFKISLQTENQYQVGDLLYVFIPYKMEEDGYYQIFTIQATVETIDTEGSANDIYVSVDQTTLEDAGVEQADQEQLFKNLVGLVTFLVGRNGEKIDILRYSKNSIDLLQSQTFEEEQDLASIRTRIGDLQELNKTVNVQQTNSLGTINENITPDVSNNKFGIYSDKLISDKSEQFNANLYAPIFKGGPNLNLFPTYEDNLLLPTEDDSQIVVTSEWVRRLLKKLIPPGTIVAWSGTGVPDGWALCDGTNGTPNLIDKFIKGGSSNGATGGNEEITLTVNNLPPHNHTCSTDTHSHSISRSQYGYDNDGGSIQTWTIGSDYTETTTQDSHSHTIGTTGLGEPIKIEPPYYTLMYIMRLDD